MSYLLDTNCWMQLIRDRALAQEVDDLLRRIPSSDVFITDYGLHSLINVTHRRGWLDTLSDFLAIAHFGSAIGIVTVPPPQLQLVVDAIRLHRLDVDDAYHYVAADLHGLKLVSLDADFDRTPAGRLTPAAALKLFLDSESPGQPS